MKKIGIFLLALSMLLASFSSCSRKPQTGGPDPTYDPSVVDEDTPQSLFDILTGECLSMTALNGGKALVDNSGMSGLWASNHLHAAFDGSTETGAKYVSEMMVATTELSSLYFDLGSVQALGQLCIWNYGDLSDLGSCVKDIQISYSEDNVTYYTLGTFTLAQSSAEDAAAHGGFIASNLADSGLPIDLNGIAAQYLVLTPLSNYGGSKYGLSEIRVFRQKKRPSKGDLIWPESFTPRSETNAENLTNGTGMSVINATVDSSETADNDPAHMWHSEGRSGASLVVLNLDGTYPLSTLKIWNYNDPNNLNAGTKEVEISYTTTEACSIHQSETEQDYLDFEKGNWEKLGRYTIPQGTGDSSLPASLEIDLKGIHAQHIKIKPLSNYGGSGFGLSEVRVYAADGWAVEPARLWNGVVNTSGSFAYQGNTAEDPFAKKDQGGGWVGGDGIFSTSLTDAQLPGSINENSVTLFTFQDSFVGNFGNYRTFSAAEGYFRSPGFSMGMKNMAYMFLHGNTPDVRNVQYHYELNNDLSRKNEGGNILPGKYWICDSTPLGGYVFTVGAQVGDNGWSNGLHDFYIQKIDPETNEITMDETAVLYKKEIDTDLPKGLEFEPLFEDGEYIYQYGKNKNEGDRMAVRRTTPQGYIDRSGWEYWDGSIWNTDPKRAVTISDHGVGGEFSVTYMGSGPFAGKYIAVYTEGSIWGTVSCTMSDSITGPFRRMEAFTDTKSLFFAPERYQMYLKSYKDSFNYYVQWNYNAKPQPAISKEGELLITYHFGLHDDRVPSQGWFGGLGKEYEEPSFINLIEIK